MLYILANPLPKKCTKVCRFPYKDSCFFQACHVRIGMHEGCQAGIDEDHVQHEHSPVREILLQRVIILHLSTLFVLATCVHRQPLNKYQLMNCVRRKGSQRQSTPALKMASRVMYRSLQLTITWSVGTRSHRCPNSMKQSMKVSSRMHCDLA